MTQRSRKSIQKIILHARRTSEYVSGMSEADFQKDFRTLEAVAFNVSQIGELAKLVDKEIIDENKHIDWVAMRGLRNRIVHDYDHVSPTILWAITKTDLPKLANDLEAILAAE